MRNTFSFTPDNSMDSCNDDVLHLILFENLSSSPRGGLSTVMVQCRLVCKRWNETILGWPKYKEIKARADNIGLFLDNLNYDPQRRQRKLSDLCPREAWHIIRYLETKGEERYPELAFGLLQNLRALVVGSGRQNMTQMHMKLIGMCESIERLVLKFHAGNVGAFNFDMIRLCKSLSYLLVVEGDLPMPPPDKSLIDISPLLSLPNLREFLFCPPFQTCINGRQMWLLVRHIAAVSRADRAHPTEKA